MKRYFYIFTFIAISLIGYSFFMNTKSIKILNDYNFNNGNWVLIKGHHKDSIQYAITDTAVLNRIKEDWLLFKSSRNFATTGGYNVELFQNNDRKMFMDIINDGEISQKSSGILYNSDFETLGYQNLDWLNSNTDEWKKVRAIEMEFGTLKAKSEYLDSLKATINTKLTVVSEIDKENEHYIYVIYELN